MYWENLIVYVWKEISLTKNAQRNIKKMQNKDEYGQFEGQGRTLCREKTNPT